MQIGPKSSRLRELQDQAARLAGRFYDVGSGVIEKLGRPFQPILPPLARRLSKRPEVLGAELFVALALTVSFFFLVRPTCRVSPNGNAISKALFSYLSNNADPAGKQDIQLNWQKRLAGPIISGWLIDVKLNGRDDLTQSELENIFGLYHATWLFFLFLALIVYRRDALLLMLGTIAGLMYYLSEEGGPQFYPWDVATMFFFTLACLLYSNRQMWLLMLVVWIGALFKETTLCCALLILLGEPWPLRKRIFGFVGTVLITFASYKLLMGLYHMNAHLFAMNQAACVHDLVWKSVMVNNLHTLFSLEPRHVLFANAGGLFLMLLIPWKNRQGVVLKLLIVGYIIGEFFWGIINEFRIWYEVLPLGWMIISTAWFTERPVTPPKAANRIWKGSYWLMMSALFIIAAIGCLATKPAPPPPADDAANLMTLTELLVAAPKGNVNAQYRLGIDYQEGAGVEKDTFEATHWYQRAAEKGHLEAQNALGVILFEQKDYTNAAKWFERCAATGDANSECNLAALYSRGLGVGQNDELAFQWFQKAARHGSMQAQTELGRIYEAGRGVKPDYVAAYQWLKLAQLQGAEKAETELRICAAAMTPAQIAEAEQRVEKYKAEPKGTP